ncbi:acetate--CoA ligase [Thauera aminoaromatica]|uniref:acetate--CoA ligase n=2 Tax=Thauera aminoaromatica TaxID=164330 RepID=N6YMZ7_THASP|nr:acetate--CoA ligase [Thauera aminoaromatica]ACK54171.1 AMP-dependent synthetase and ligase [Thauera aminoaromatica]ENO83528.1 acetyl-CoA synthetase [Thauera aminoaromatica S2]
MQRPAIIHKTAADLAVPPNLADYAATCAGFSWDAARAELAGLPGGGLNIAHEAVERHAHGPLRERIAFRFLGENSLRDVGYGELSRLTSRFANVLRTLGVRRGERVFVLTGRIPELYIAVLGGLKAGCVVSPLFSAFGPEPIATRIGIGEGAVLVTTDLLYERKVAKLRDRLPSLRHVLLVGEEDGATAIPATQDLAMLMAQAADTFETVATRPEDLALLHFTSGTTGTPKGAMHVHGAVLTHWATGRYALDLHDGDIFWCTADPGWVTGTSYGIVAPLLHGVSSIVDVADFDAERWYRILQEQRVSVWYTAPTAIRMLMKAGPELARGFSFPRLRFVASVGEPLNPEAVWWGRDVLGKPIHDNWWQTETGGIMIANLPALDIKPGSMGKPLPGVEAAIVRPREGGGVEFVDAPDEEGELALKRGWPSMLRGYLNNEERYRKCFAGDWYLTGDLARRDADGYYWFVGRSDDVIKSAGHLIGPFEVESALMEHPAVAEAGVIGKPDDMVGEVVKAFVSLKQGFEPSEALRKELLGHARKKLGAAVAPKEIDFLPVLPRTRSGKIMRRLLKARELGLPEGDTSTLEAGA